MAYQVTLKKRAVEFWGPNSAETSKNWFVPSALKQFQNYAFLFFSLSCETKSSREFEDFNIFYHKFNSDSLFQMERIAFPLPGIRTEEMSVLDSIYSWKKED